MSPDLWQRCCDRLAAELPEQQFATWIRPLPPGVVSSSEAGPVMAVRVPNRFKLDWIRNQYAPRIETLLAELAGRPVKLELSLTPRDLPQRPAAPQMPAAHGGVATGQYLNGSPAMHAGVGMASPLIPAPAAQPSKSRLNPSLTFDTLVPGRANQMARAAAMHVAGAPGQLYNPLFIYGGVGLGKTHLMHAVGNALLADNPNARSPLHPRRAVRLRRGQGLSAQDLRRVQGQVPLARPAADRRRAVLRQQGPHAGRVLQRLRGAAGQEAATS